MSRLLINENPMMILPNLAEKIGLNEAVVLQQLHYLMNPEFNKNFINGRYWVYNTYEQWQKKFKFWSVPTVKRIFLNLEEKGLVLTDRFNEDSHVRTKWYTIDYESLNRLDVGAPDQIDTMGDQRIKMIHDNGSNRSVQTDQNDPMYIEQRLHTKITSKDITTRACASALNGVSENQNVEPSIDASVDQTNKLVTLNKSRRRTLPSRLGKVFDSFWEAYPYKEGKGAAERAFPNALQLTTVDEMISALETQKLYRQERMRLRLFVPPYANPATWLNEKRWLSEPLSHEELKIEAQASMRSKMSYRDEVKVHAMQKRGAIEQRIRERALNTSIQVQCD